MAYGFEKLVSDNKLNVAELPEEVKLAIDYLRETDKGIALIKKRLAKLGKDYKQSEMTSRKIKQLDAWAVRGISEHLDGHTIDGGAPLDDKDILKLVVDDNKTATTGSATTKSIAVKPVVTTATNTAVIANEPVVTPATTTEPTAHELDIELSALHKAKVTVFTLEELKAKAPKSYDIVFESYKEGEGNGLETSNFSLIETDKKFILKKM